jgi:hypothetical protein
MAAPECFGTEHVNINFIYISFFIYLTIIDYLIFSMVINHALSSFCPQILGKKISNPH